jgi:hypothetical protein
MIGLYRIKQNYLHKNCIHYKNGFCDLNQMPVNPDKPACPRFTPEKPTGTGEEKDQFQSSLQSNQEHPPEIGQVFTFGKRINRLNRRRNRIMYRGRKGRKRKR